MDCLWPRFVLICRASSTRQCSSASFGVDMILLILTSHRADCFSLCLRCLEQHTDLSAFEFIYIMGNALEAEHAQLAARFAARHRNAALVAFGPRGMEPVMRAQDLVLARHKNSVVVKLDEDVFVTPGWLGGLLGAYRSHKGCGLVSALVPNNDVGQRMLHAHFCEVFPEYAADPGLQRTATSTNSAYALWLWRNILDKRLEFSREGWLKNLSVTRIEGYLNINCILVDPVFLDYALPFGERGVTDEFKLNAVLSTNVSPMFGLMTPESLAHHYSFRLQQEALDARIGLDAVAAWMFPESARHEATA